MAQVEWHYHYQTGSMGYRKFRVFNMSSSGCQLHIHVDMSSRLMNTSQEFRGEVQPGGAHLGGVSM